MVDGVFSRAFKTGVRPVELGRRMLREMDEHRSVDVHGRRIVPNQFAFFLSPTDITTFSGIEDALIDELVESAKDYAAQEGYYFMGLVTVDFVERGDMRTGRFVVVSQMNESAVPHQRAGQHDSYDPYAPQPYAADAGQYDDLYQDEYGDPDASPYQAADPASSWDDPSGGVDSPWAPLGSGSGVTPPPMPRVQPRQPAPAPAAAAPQAPAPQPAARPTAYLHASTGERVPLGNEPAVIGRLAGCAVVVSDLNVSRRHAHVRRNGGVYVVADLGSTNGTLVNGIRIDGERVLHNGDIISVGSTQLRFEAS
jgi:hypothetical protein